MSYSDKQVLQFLIDRYRKSVFGYQLLSILKHKKTVLWYWSFLIFANGLHSTKYIINVTLSSVQRVFSRILRSVFLNLYTRNYFYIVFKGFLFLLDTSNRVLFCLKCT